MDFFAAQDRARGRTRTLIAYFILGVSALVVSMYVLVLIALTVSQNSRSSNAYSHYGDSSSDQAQGFVWWQPDTFGLVMMGTLVVVGGACLIKISQLRQGGAALALSMGCKPVSPQTTNLAERRLRDIVEEMALAAGVPVPEIFVMEEEGINAFAAGFRPEDAAITVTRGSLTYLSRDELQGVIGHEFSHILNGDMKLGIELIGAIYGLMVLTVVGREMFFIASRSGRSRNSGNAAIVMILLGVVLMVIGGLGMLFGRLIQAGVSRQREILADASAVQFTRNPEGLAGALKKIGGLGAGSLVGHSQETAHLFFAAPMTSLFATHPPIEERIRALDPNWDGKFITPHANNGEEIPYTSRVSQRDPAPVKAATLGLPPSLAGVLVMPVGLAAAASLGSIQSWRGNLPAAIAAALTSATGCRALTLVLALDDDPVRRAAQLEQLREHEEPAANQAADLAESIAAVPTGRRLPLLELALAGLANTSVPEKNSLSTQFRALTGFDNNPTLHSFALWRVAEYRLKPRPPRLGPADPEFYRSDVSVVLSALAHLSTADDAAAQPVFAQGLAALPALPGATNLTPRATATIEQVEISCAKLEGAPFALKKQLLDAGARIAQADGIVEPSEAELLRALAASMGCPLPPG